MWAEIEVVPSEIKTIYLPSSLAMNCAQTTLLKFGGISTEASLQYKDDLELTNENSFEKPGKIKLSDKLKNDLFIPESLVYQVKISDSSIAIGPVIGLLLGDDIDRYNPEHMKKYSDRFGIYNKVGGLIFAFPPKLINWKNNVVYGLYYNIKTLTWEYGCFPLPEVIYRRDFHSNPEFIKRLIKFTNGRLFNSYRFSKYELYDCLKMNYELNKYLPPTKLVFGFSQVRKFINRHTNVILKPIHLSRGRGICIIEKKDYGYKITDYRHKHPIVSELYDDEGLRNFFTINQDFFNKYLMQKYLSLSKIGDAIFDIRVVMQKSKDKEWGCTGIECRVSHSSHLTNISRGGYALPLKEALLHAFPSDYELLSWQINKLCRNFCLYMDTIGEHFAEFGLDLAIDVDKNLWLIEANVFPSFKGFRKMDPQTYLSIRYTPFLYALSLTPFGE